VLTPRVKNGGFVENFRESIIEIPGEARFVFIGNLGFGDEACIGV
jgi:hypothetical protein